MVRDRVINDSFESMLVEAGCTLRKFKRKLILVTGSVGKTSTKEMLAHVLRCSGLSVYHSSDSWNFTHEMCAQIVLNAQWAEFLVFEVAIGEHLPTVGRLLPPDILIFTHLGAVHTEQFPSLREIAQLKVSLAAHMDQQGIVIFNADVDDLRGAVSSVVSDPMCHARTASFGSARLGVADVVVRKGEGEGEGLVFVVDRRGGGPSFKILLAESKSAHAGNVAAVFIATEYVGVLPSEIVRALSSWSGVPARFEEISIGSKTLVNDAYNANPVSMRAFLDELDSYKTRGSRVCVIMGEMADLGDQTPEQHAALAREAQGRFHSLILVGETFARLGFDKEPWCTWFRSADEVRDNLSDILHDHDVLGIKGSYCTNLLSICLALSEEPGAC